MAPKATTSKTPPSDSFALRWTLMCSTIARLASRSRQRTGSSSTPSKSSTRSGSSRAGARDRADLHHVRADLDAERAQEGLGQRAAGDARGGLARARALEHVAHVGQAVLPRADEVGVAGARQVDLGHLGLHRPRVHPLLPVGEVAVGDLQGDRAAERAPVADPAGDLRAVALDLHPPAAAVAELAARHVAVDRLAVELEARGQALDDAGQAGAVRLAGGDELQRHRAPKCMDGFPAARRRRTARPRPAGRAARPWRRRARRRRRR